MRIPPHYQQPKWQRFFAGAAIGAIISWSVFLFMFGIIQENHRTTINKQDITIQKLKKEIKVYEEEYSKLNEEAQQKVTVQEIHVHLTNGDKYLPKKFYIKSIEENVKRDLSDLIAKDIESVYSNHTLIEKTIENQTIPIDGKDYKLEVTKLMIYTTIDIEIEISFAK